MTPEITLLHIRGTEIGYARMGSYLARELADRGVDVYDADGSPQPYTVELQSENRRVADPPTNLVCLCSVPTHSQGRWKGQHNAAFTMFETNALPEAFRESFPDFDTLIVPSLQNVELFSKYHDNVKYVPLGVDPEVWHYTPPPAPEREFRFLINGRGARKGTDLAYKAFRTVFADPSQFSPRPRLLMKSLKGVNEWFGEDVEQVVGRVTDVEEASLHASCHCYLGPSRGEGFGLVPLQAMALGRPTILTNAHGHAGYAHLGIPLSWEYAPSNYFIWGDAQDWWEPDFEELCEAMWDVYSHYDAHAERAKESAEVIAREWTWHNTADKFIEHLGDQMNMPYTGEKVWVKNTALMYRITVDREFGPTSIAGRTLHFYPGKDYYEIADIKRILWEAGVLANDCLTDDDPGLAPRQVAELGKYRADHEYCPTCTRRYSDGMLHSDAIFEEMLNERGLVSTVDSHIR